MAGSESCQNGVETIQRLQEAQNIGEGDVLSKYLKGGKGILRCRKASYIDNLGHKLSITQRPSL